MNAVNILILTLLGLLVGCTVVSGNSNDPSELWYLQEEVSVCTIGADLAPVSLSPNCPLQIQKLCHTSIFVPHLIDPHCDALVGPSSELEPHAFRHKILMHRNSSSQQLPQVFFFSSSSHSSHHDSMFESAAQGLCEVCRKIILWKTIQKKYLVPPNLVNDYNLECQSRDHDFTQYGQRQILRSIDWHGHLNSPPFFLEVGAFSGLRWSNTIDLEFHGWTGLLIEANPQLFTQLLSVNRKAWSINVCLSSGTEPSMEEFEFAGAIGGVVKHFYVPHVGRIQSERRSTGKQPVPCFPLVEILKAMGQKTIDFFSLDVEGGEKAIMKSIDWKQVSIRVLCMEADYKDPERFDIVDPFMDYMGRRAGDEWWRTKSEPMITLPFPPDPDRKAARNH